MLTLVPQWTCTFQDRILSLRIQCLASQLKRIVHFNQGPRARACDDWEPPGDDCVLREADSRRIPKLTIKVPHTDHEEIVYKTLVSVVLLELFGNWPRARGGGGRGGAELDTCGCGGVSRHSLGRTQNDSRLHLVICCAKSHRTGAFVLSLEQRPPVTLV